MKRIPALLLSLFLTGILATVSAAEPGTELPPKAKAYVEKVSTLMGKNSTAQRYHIKDKPGAFDRFLVKKAYVSYAPETGVLASFNEVWYKVLEKQLPSKAEMSAEMLKTDEPGDFAFAAACALQRECSLTIGYRADRFKDLGELVTLTFTYEELVKICSKFK